MTGENPSNRTLEDIFFVFFSSNQLAFIQLALKTHIIYINKYHISAKSLQSCGCLCWKSQGEAVWSLHLHVVEVQWVRFPTNEFTCFNLREFTTLEDKHGPGFMVIFIL